MCTRVIGAYLHTYFKRKISCKSPKKIFDNLNEHFVKLFSKLDFVLLLHISLRMNTVLSYLQQ